MYLSGAGMCHIYRYIHFHWNFDIYVECYEVKLMLN